MAEQTIRFRAESRITYAQAIVALVRLARDTTREFDIGPLDVTALEDYGLAVSGPDLEQWADDFLASVPGLHRADD